MPTTLTYPGVYIEELPSGVRSIAGVATSITAFVGWAPQGPKDRAVRIFSFTDYERVYGAIQPTSYLGYAVKHYFENGGADAYVLRLTDSRDFGKTTAGGINFVANSPGDWSNFYGVSIHMSSSGERFTVRVWELAKTSTGAPDPDPNKAAEVESFSNLSIDPKDARYINEVINDEVRGSLLIRLEAVPTSFSDDPTPKAFRDGKDVPPADLADINNARFTALLDAATVNDGVLDQIDLFNLFCVPGLTAKLELEKLLSFCKRRRAMLIADCEVDAKPGSVTGSKPSSDGTINAAYYFPWVKAPDPLSENRITDFPPCGFVAGVYARTDSARGIWKAPAGIDAALNGVFGPKEPLTDQQNGAVNVKAVNCLRTFPNYGLVVWGARTLDGDDDRGSEWKYIPVRRTALYIEESLFRGTKWAVFEPNDEPLWSQIRLNVGAFMHDLFRQGAFQGRSPRDAYFVRCDSETTTQSDINRGIVNIVVGFAPLKPAEFVVIKLTQIAGQLAS